MRKCLCFKLEINTGDYGMNSGDKLMRIEKVMEYTGLSRSSIYNYMKQGKFPDKRKFGKSSFWSFNEVQDWISGVTG